MPKAERDLKVYGKCAYLFDDDPESIKAAKEAMRKNALEFLEKENILQIITRIQGDVSPDGFPIIPDGPEIKATVGWKLDMNPLLKKPDLNEQPVPKPLTEFLSWLGTELIGSVNAVFQRPGKHTAIELYTDTVDAIKDVISKKIDMNQGRLIR